VGDLLAIREREFRDVVRSTGLGSAYAMVLEFARLCGEAAIHHVPAILWHQMGEEAGPDKEDLERHLRLSGVSAQAMPDRGAHLRLRYELPENPPKVSIIVPTRDMLHFLKPCVESLLARTTWPDYEVLIVDNQSTCRDTLAFMETVEADDRVRILRYKSFAVAFWDVFKVVTAFTVAHSITLTLAALGVIALPSRLVESAIAASVVLAALNNVRPAVYGGRWAIAFLFGLIHGFGFASVLADLGLPRESLLLSLVAFNVGVELGQLAIVAMFLPVAYALRATRFYRRVILVGGSLAVAAIAFAWLLERAFNWSLLPDLG
jgi:hypothetical protein